MLETEVKLAVQDLEAMRERLAELGWRPSAERALERNTLYDNPERMMVRLGRLLRVREIRGRAILTVKLPSAVEGRHKVREEHEVEGEAAALYAIVAGLGFEPAWRYEKYRTTYRHDDEPGVIELDETPVGCFLELEGPADWIDRTAPRLGFSAKDYMTENYYSLFVAWKTRTGSDAAHMVFDEPAD